MRVSLACLLLILSLSGSMVLAQDDPELTETPEPSINITIWWPDSFARVNESDINPILMDQSAEFADLYPNVVFEHRLKAVGQPGGIMSTLRSASRAAPDVLPTLTLVRRQDLIFARAAGYLQSLEGFSSVIQSDLNNSLQLGQFEDGLFGVPYLLELQHMVYRPTDGVDYSSWTFDAVLERGEPFAFAGSRSNSLNDVVALQYIEGGGISSRDHTLTLDQSSLTNIFEFYESARDQEILSDIVTTYTNSTVYEQSFIDGDINAAIFSSTRYLNLYHEDDSLAMATIPSETGDPISFMNAWMWVMVTQEGDEQAIALNYLNWMFDADRQAELAEDVLMLPSREAAFEIGLANNVPAAPYQQLVENALIPLTEGEIGNIGREMQTQFTNIFTSDASAVSALQAVLDVVSE